MRTDGPGRLGNGVPDVTETQDSLGRIITHSQHFRLITVRTLSEADKVCALVL